MRIQSRRSLGWLAALGLFGVTALPSTVEAQLFPNRTIRRQRNEPAQEPPFYSNIRQNYFGYYPTCWQKFPDGWACPCPNPEAPNVAAEFEKRKRDDKSTLLPPDDLGALPEGDAAGGAMGGAAGAGRGARPNNVPSLPDRGSPFELDTPRSGGGVTTPPRTPDLSPPRDGGRLLDVPNSGNTNTPPAGALPGGTRPVPPAGGPAPARPDPFDPRPGGASRAPATGLPEMQPLTAPTTSRNDSARPMLELPSLSPPSSTDPATDLAGSSSAQPFPGSLSPNGPVVENSAPAPLTAPDASAPKRKSVIGGFFNSLNRRR